MTFDLLLCSQNTIKSCLLKRKDCFHGDVMLNLFPRRAMFFGFGLTTFKKRLGSRKVKKT